MWRYGQQLIHNAPMEKREAVLSEKGGRHSPTMSYDTEKLKEARRAGGMYHSVEGGGGIEKILNEPTHGVSSQHMAERANNLG